MDCQNLKESSEDKTVHKAYSSFTYSVVTNHQPGREKLKQVPRLQTSLDICLRMEKEHEKLTIPIGLERYMAYMKREFEITWRMLAVNLFSGTTPGLIFTMAVCLYQEKTPRQTWIVFGRAAVIFFLYAYTFDASNQSRGADEDKINKPHRPIPRGLLTPAGCIRRFWAATAIYAIVGFQFGVLKWVILWNVSLFINNIWCPPRYYWFCKTPCMALAVVAQLAQAWQLVDPMASIDITGTRWITFMAVIYPLPLIFEDIRDMAGDESIGRRTPALIWGSWPVRIWFATFMMAIPILAHFLLFIPTAALPWRIALTDLLLMATCWTAAARSLVMRNLKADRVTYQLLIFSYVVSLICGCILWA